ncbi:beta-lactamase family protein [Kitasatospora sp. RG8]|uniref:serine hydrolase domain-containing protein n=1 Tax=Kitasatospora sp. RG8 TaxID=2820815 RepID=UPI001ADFFD28|nr:serine hydrolase domain-containing protein [Kitasatospora sp. RG8]MBP0448598.1 beta-lactamase family protein [Kitasatospora sp. RG8]
MEGLQGLQGELQAVVDSGAVTWDLARVVADGRTVWKGAAGVSDLSGRRPVDPDGRFRIGSITKTFTATVVLQLVGEGRIRLDAPVETYLPGVVPNGAGISVRQLLNHTSGLFNYNDLPEYVPVDQAGLAEWVRVGRWRTFSAPAIVADATSHAPYFAPGRDFHYSNTNYLLAGMLIERTTGRSWNEEVERRIIRPLGLRDTSMPTTSPLLTGPHAHQYLVLASGPVDATLMNPSLAGAAGAGISTAADLARFQSALLGGGLLRPAELAEMKRTVDTHFGVAYGLGLMRFDVVGCGELWGHLGGIRGNVSYFFGDPAGRRQVVTAGGLYGQVDSSEVFTDLNRAAACG